MVLRVLTPDEVEFEAPRGDIVEAQRREGSQSRELNVCLLYIYIYIYILGSGMREDTTE